jgi:hypothetical protein
MRIQNGGTTNGVESHMPTVRKWLQEGVDCGLQCWACDRGGDQHDSSTCRVFYQPLRDFPIDLDPIGFFAASPWSREAVAIVQTQWKGLADHAQSTL